MNNSLNLTSEGISFKVYVRVRPFNEKEKQYNNDINFLQTDKKTITVKHKDKLDQQKFTFDTIYDMQTKQESVYKQVANDLIDNALAGINGTIFCYGQTSSGKTHTIVGDYEGKNKLNQGIVPRVINELVLRKEQKIKNKTEAKIDINIKISMVEIYNEKVKDLIDLNKVDLKIRQNKKQGIFIENVTEKSINTANDGGAIIKQGIQNRTVGRTNMNALSSRSHMLFIITITSTNFETKEVKCAKLTLVDLAGSQKISKTGVEGKMLQQAKKINTSLTALSKVISALSEGKSSHVPYRDSKLTRILQESIGGNSLTRLIVNISPSQTNHPEIISSLRFGQSAKMIKNTPKVNKQYTVEQLTALLEKAELKIKKQIQIIQKYKKIVNQEGKSRKNISQADTDDRAITLHMINYEDQLQMDEENFEDDNNEDQQSENKSRCKSVSDHGKKDKQFNASGNCFFNNTAQFNSTGPLRKPVRKPTIHNYLARAKSMQSHDQNGQLERKHRKKITICLDDGVFINQVRSKKPNTTTIIQECSRKQIEQDSFERQLKDISQKKINQDKQNEKPFESQSQKFVFFGRSPTKKEIMLPIQNKDQEQKEKMRLELQQTLKKQITQKLREQLTLKFKEDLELKQCTKIYELKQEVCALSFELQVKKEEMKELAYKYQSAVGDLEQKQSTLKIKEQKIKALKQKYQAKKQQITLQIGKLRQFWQNQVKI